MGLPLRHILEMDSLRRAEVIASEAALQRDVESVTIIEVTEGRIQDYVEKNQLCMTTMYSIRSDPEKQEELVRILHAKGCSGIIVCHIGVWVKELPSRLVSLCRELDFPLIIPASDTVYVDILNPIIYELMNRQTAAPQTYSAVQSDIVEIIVRSDNVFTALHSIADRAGYAVSCFDPYGYCLFSDEPTDSVEELRQYFKEHFNYIFSVLVREKKLVLQESMPPRLLYLVTAHNHIRGIVVLKLKENGDNAAAFGLGDVFNTVFALMVGRQNTADSIRSHYEQEYINDLLVWNFGSRETALRRGREVGMRFAGHNCVMVINFNDIQKMKQLEDADAVSRKIVSEHLENITYLCRGIDESCIVVSRADQVLVFLTVAEDGMHQVRGAGGKICELLLKSAVHASVGISRCFGDIAEIPDAYNQAKNAMLLGREYWGNGSVCAFEDIYYLNHLRQMRTDAAAVGIANDILRPICEHDAQNKSDLLQTLRYMVRYGYNVDILSKKLYVHRNTLLNRKEKITEILGYSPLEMPHILNLYIAFEMLEQGGEAAEQ